MNAIINCQVAIVERHNTILNDRYNPIPRTPSSQCTREQTSELLRSMNISMTTYSDSATTFFVHTHSIRDVLWGCQQNIVGRGCKLIRMEELDFG